MTTLTRELGLGAYGEWSEAERRKRGEEPHLASRSDDRRQVQPQRGEREAAEYLGFLCGDE